MREPFKVGSPEMRGMEVECPRCGDWVDQHWVAADGSFTGGHSCP